MLRAIYVSWIQILGTSPRMTVGGEDDRRESEDAVEGVIAISGR